MNISLLSLSLSASHSLHPHYTVCPSPSLPLTPHCQVFSLLSLFSHSYTTSPLFPLLFSSTFMSCSFFLSPPFHSIILSLFCQSLSLLPLCFPPPLAQALIFFLSTSNPPHATFVSCSFSFHLHYIVYLPPLFLFPPMDIAPLSLMDIALFSLLQSPLSPSLSLPK